MERSLQRSVAALRARDRPAFTRSYGRAARQRGYEAGQHTSAVLHALLMRAMRHPREQACFVAIGVSSDPLNLSEGEAYRSRSRAVETALCALIDLKLDVADLCS